MKALGHVVLQNFASDRIVLDWLLDQGVDINRTDCRRLDCGSHLAEDEYDDSLHVLNQVAANGDIILLRYLVARGADLTKSVALHAVSRCHDLAASLPMLSYLLDEQHLDIDTDNDEFRYLNNNHEKDIGTPLCLAIYERNLPVALELIARGANVHKFGGRGCEPVKKAIGETRDLENGCLLPVIRPLIAAGVDASYAMEHAIIVLRLEPAKLLLQCGADPVTGLREALEQDVEIRRKGSRAMRERSQAMVRLLEHWVEKRKGPYYPE
ncbi:uncharacterized protein MYCGRDRAFT_102079 [Zymoseptoria tritici IPO323]|uniref:Ankyrin repeat protein n=1 Tax=Zymoseptoria tritici (strain CBS 115943 / IPO323) TaxID=336722 RepID=F9WZR4_ZYMTI|nr:uncharacterized protein MYCGRDRAFT_102079 [Zymoseptoria tritici IPO323]EGP90937.1 hypothetical protein MYCGRDRAFT_102079 [Zymoseptoria tritici IPO323]